MKRTQIYLKDTQYKNLKAYSDAKSVSLSEGVREMVDVGYEVTTKTKLLKTKTHGVGDLLLKSRNSISFDGPKNLSKNIDKFVYEI